MLEIPVFPVKVSLGWHFRDIFLLCAPIRKQSEKLSWVHKVDSPSKNANRVESPLYFGRKTGEFRKGMGARRPKISVTAQRPGISGKTRRSVQTEQCVALFHSMIKQSRPSLRSEEEKKTLITSIRYAVSAVPAVS